MMHGYLFSHPLPAGEFNGPAESAVLDHAQLTEVFALVLNGTLDWKNRTVPTVSFQRSQDP